MPLIRNLDLDNIPDGQDSDELLERFLGLVQDSLYSPLIVGALRAFKPYEVRTDPDAAGHELYLRGRPMPITTMSGGSEPLEEPPSGTDVIFPSQLAAVLDLFPPGVNGNFNNLALAFLLSGGLLIQTVYQTFVDTTGGSLTPVSYRVYEYPHGDVTSLPLVTMIETGEIIPTPYFSIILRPNYITNPPYWPVLSLAWYDEDGYWGRTKRTLRGGLPVEINFDFSLVIGEPLDQIPMLWNAGAVILALFKERETLPSVLTAFDPQINFYPLT